MVEQTEALCDLWEGISASRSATPQPTLPVWKPIGVANAPMVESLTGHVKRLCSSPLCSQCERS